MKEKREGQAAERNRAVFPALIAIILCICIPFTRVFADARRIGAEPAAEISRETGAAELERRIGSLLPPDNGSIIVFGRPDQLLPVLNPLRKSGRLKAVTFVLPDESSLAPGTEGWFRELLVSNGIPETALSTFRLDNGVYSGTANGSSLSFMSLPETRSTPSDCLLVLDCRFFLGLYRNPVGTPIVQLARKLMATLANGRVSATAVILYEPIEEIDYPLENGFTPWLLWDMLAVPGAFERDIPEKWKQFEAAESARYFMLYAEAYQAYRNYLKSDPGDASIHYRIAQMAALDQVPQYALESLETASTLDPAYRRAYAELGKFLAEKGVTDLAEDALKKGLARFPADPVIASTLARVYLARGEKALHSGRPADALPEFQAAASVAGADPAIVDEARSFLRATPVGR